MCFWSVKVGFRLFGVLEKYGFHSASKSLNQFCFGWSQFLIIWQVKFLVVAKVNVVCENLVSLATVSFFSQQVFSSIAPNKACTRQVGLCAVFKHFPGFKFFPASKPCPRPPTCG